MLLLLVAAVTLLSAFVQGITGFGYALVAAPLLAILLTEKESVLIILGFTTIINFYLFARYKKQVQFKKMKLLVLPAVAGVIVGSLAFPYAPEGSLSLLIGGVSLFLAFTMLVGYKVKTEYNRAANYAGAASGFFNVTTGLGGPPIVLLMAQQKVNKKQMVGSLATFFLALNVISLAGIFMSFQVTARLPMIMLVALPLAILGLLLGVKVGERINEKLFHKFVLLLILVSGSLALYSGLNKLIG